MKPGGFRRVSPREVRCLAAGDCFTAGVQAIKLLQFALKSPNHTLAAAAAAAALLLQKIGHETVKLLLTHSCQI